MSPLAPRGACLALLLVACRDVDVPMPIPPPIARPARVSGASPFAPGCSAPGPGTRYPDSEVEPHLAIDPLNPDHLVAAWQEDRWSTGGADGLVAGASLDGGATWILAPLAFSTCGGGAAPGGDYERATDPWLSFSPDGAVVHAVGLAFDGSSARNAIVATRSTDGGVTWEAARVLAEDADLDVALDKPTLTADPGRAGVVYAVWDRLTGLLSDPSASTGPAWLARSTDGGVTWEAPRVLHDPGLGAQTIASQIVVLPDGALVSVFVRIAGEGTRQVAMDVVASRSADGGATWTGPVLVNTLGAIGAVDGKTGRPIRAGEVVPSSAVDGSGRVWVAWQDARFSGGARDGIALAVSGDGGVTWSAPVQANREPRAQAFRPAVGTAGGTVAVTYYDLRYDLPQDETHTWATVFRAETVDGGVTWAEVPEGGPFDLRTTPDAGGWFVGDYTGLLPRRAAFEAVFSMGSSPLGPGTHVFASAAAGAVPAASALQAPQVNATPLPLEERLRAIREVRPR